MFGILTSGIVLLITLSLVASVEPFAVLPVDLAMLGTEIVVALFYAAGLVGAGLLVARRSRSGVYLMLVAAIGAAVVRFIQPLLVGIAGNIGVPERLTEEPSLSSTGSLTYTLVLTAALLLACALGTLVIRNQRVS